MSKSCKRYEIDKITDILEIPPESLDDFLIDLKSYHELGQLWKGLADALGEAGSAQLKRFVWIDDGKHERKVNVEVIVKEKSDE